MCVICVSSNVKVFAHGHSAFSLVWQDMLICWCAVCLSHRGSCRSMNFVGLASNGALKGGVYLFGCWLQISTVVFPEMLTPPFNIKTSLTQLLSTILQILSLFSVCFFFYLFIQGYIS